MAGLEQRQGVLHTIEAWLYRNYLPAAEDEYIARLKTDKTLTVEDVCAAATTRGGSDINYDTMVQAVTAFLLEMVYQLADGFSIILLNLLSVHPKIGGTFHRADSPVDPDKNKVSLTFRKLAGLLQVLGEITVDIRGAAGVDAYIAEVQDVISGSTDELLIPGGAMRILGNRIKVAGSDPACGVYFVNAETGAAIKNPANLIDNSSNRVAALIPMIPDGTYRIRIVTQFTGGSSLLKEPRTIESEAPLTVSIMKKTA